MDKSMEKKKMFLTTKIADGVTAIQDMSKVYCYLVEGSRKAALIDAGNGVGHLKKFVETLTDKPIQVLLTHGHQDHAGGIFDFEEEQVYVHPADVELATGMANSFETRLDYLKLMNGGVCPCGEEEVLSYREMKLNTFKEGDRFELGGKTLEVIGAAGHTRGSVVFLDREDRILFSSDSANLSTFLQLDCSTTVETYLKSLERIAGHQNEYDLLVIAHGTTVVSKQVIPNLIELCGGILKGEIEGTPMISNFSFSQGARWAAPVREDGITRCDGKIGNLVYRPERVTNKE